MATDEPIIREATAIPPPEPLVIVVTATLEPTLPVDGDFVDRRPTLPPTFTPTATDTATLTPTVTLTPSHTPTFTLADICERFNVTINLFAGETYDMVGTVGAFVDTGGPEISARLTLRNTDADEDVLFVIPGGPAYPASFPLDLSTGPGAYTWSITAETAAYQSICESSAAFNLRSRSPVEVMFEALDDLRTGGATSPVTEPTGEPGTPIPEITPEVTAIP